VKKIIKRPLAQKRDEKKGNIEVIEEERDGGLSTPSHEERSDIRS
jgi:hypothetical protein